MERDIELLLQEYRDKGALFAKARAMRGYLDDFKKSKFALLMRDAEVQGYKTAAAQEREAYASEVYHKTMLEAVRDAVEEEERLRFDMKADEMAFEAWRTMKADERAEKKVYGA
jgi:hypothetical protein